MHRCVIHATSATRFCPNSVSYSRFTVKKAIIMRTVRVLFCWASPFRLVWMYLQWRKERINHTYVAKSHQQLVAGWKYCIEKLVWPWNWSVVDKSRCLILPDDGFASQYYVLYRKLYWLTLMLSVITEHKIIQQYRTIYSTIASCHFIFFAVSASVFLWSGVEAMITPYNHSNKILLHCNCFV